MNKNSAMPARHAEDVSRLPKFVDHADLRGRWAYQRLFHDLEQADDSQSRTTERTLRQFKQMHFCARRMRNLLERFGERAASRADYRRFAGLHQQFRDQIASENLGLVYNLYKQTRIRNVDGDELLSEGMMALTRAIDTFDPWRGFRFSTYACYAIIRSFYRAGMKEAKRRRHEPISFDGNLESGRWSRALKAEQAVLYAERLAKVLACRSVGLTAVERDVLARRFPLEMGAQGLTLSDIGNQMGLSKERVRQIQNSALAKLRRALEGDSVLTGAVA